LHPRWKGLFYGLTRNAVIIIDVLINWARVCSLDKRFLLVS
jgi:hypothetical protein